jgi:hypothetical protein
MQAQLGLDQQVVLPISQILDAFKIRFFKY